MGRKDTPATPVPLSLTMTTRFSRDQWIAEVTLATQQDDSGSSGYTLWTYTQAHDAANGAADLTEQGRDGAVGQFANRIARLLSAAETTATDR